MPGPCCSPFAPPFLVPTWQLGKLRPVEQYSQVVMPTRCETAGCFKNSLA